MNNSAIVIFSSENKIKVVNAIQLTTECFKRNEPFKPAYAIMFEGHLQALKS